jgi:glutamyl-tRNA synthetase
VRDRLSGHGEAFWLAVRGNIEKLADTAIWNDVIHHDGRFDVAGETDFLNAAAKLAPPAPWDGMTWKTWTDAIKAETGRKGKDLFMPLRLAITGLGHGPELANLLPLIGREKVMNRLVTS